MTRTLCLGVVAGAALLMSSCRNEGARTGSDEAAPQVEQARPIEDAEQVNPHTMGGTGGAGAQPNEPESALEVGAGNEDSQLQEPQLQDEERPPQDPTTK